MATPHVAPPRAAHMIERPAEMELPLETFLAWDHEGGLAEWIDGRVYLYPSATACHQRISQLLCFLFQIVAAVAGGVTSTAPYAMRARLDGPVREPDLVYVLPEHAARVTNKLLEGPADIVVEVVSDESVTRDRIEKFEEYQAAGVREYWLIDSREGHERADFFVLGLDPAGSGREVFRPVAIADDGIYRSTVLPDCWLRLSWLFDEHAQPLACALEVLGRERLLGVLPGQ